MIILLVNQSNLQFLPIFVVVSLIESLSHRGNLSCFGSFCLVINMGIYFLETKGLARYRS